MSAIRILAGVIFTLVLVNCSTYRGPLKPDYSLTGEAREQELQKFTIQEGFFHQGAAHFVMGGQPYWSSSLEPVLSGISPLAAEYNERAKFWRTAGLVSLGFAIAILAIELSDDDKYFSREQSLAYWSSLGFSVGAGFARASLMDWAAEQYNRDLRSQFSPSVGMSFEW